MDSLMPEMSENAIAAAEKKREQGAMFLQQGRFAEAAAVLAEAIAINPSDEGAWRLLGGAFASQGDYSRAAEAFQQSIALAPTSARNRYNLGLALQALERTHEARAAFGKALEIDPAYEAAHTKLAALGGAVAESFGSAPSSASTVAPQMPPPVSAWPAREEPTPTSATALDRPTWESQGPSPLSNSGFAPAPAVSAFPASGAGYVPPPILGQGFDTTVNNSGTREAAPPEVSAGWNWGAFYLNWIWLLNHKRVGWGLGLIGIAIVHYSIGKMNKSTAGVLVQALISLTELGVAIYLGIKGNEIGWKYRRFQSVADFKACQKIWAKWSLGLFLAYVVSIVLIVVLIIVLGMLGIAAMSGAAKAL